MSFLAPGILWALTLLAIPLIIHLFSFRRYRTILFPDVRFLKQVQEETATRNKLKHLLILLTRILALAALILAFAQPFIPSRETEQVQLRNAISIYLDNSFSMEASMDDAILIDMAKKQADAIVDAYSIDDQFQLLTNTPNAAARQWMSKEEIKEAILSVQPSPQVLTTEQVISQQFSMLSRSESGKGRAFLISDFQKSTTEAIQDTLFPVTLVSLANPAANNVAIDSAWWSAPVQVAGEQSDLVFTVTNYGPDDRTNVAASLNINGQMKGLQNLDIPAGSSVTDTISYTITGKDWQEAELKLDDYPVQFDDQLFISYKPIDLVRVLTIRFEEKDRQIEPLYKQAIFEYTSVYAGNLDYNNLASYDLIILHHVAAISTGLSASLHNALEGGASIILIPSATASLPSLNSFLSENGIISLSERGAEKRTATSINLKHPIFEGVYNRLPENLSLPYQMSGYTINQSLRSKAQALISFSNGDAMLSVSPAGSGQLYVFASPLSPEFTDLPNQGGVFVPMMYRIGLLSRNQGSPYLIAGRNQWVRMLFGLSTEEENSVQVLYGERAFIPAVRRSVDFSEISLFPYADQAGYYRVEGPDGSQLLALNYDRRESDLRAYSTDELANISTNRTTIIQSGERAVSDLVSRIQDGRPLWNFCIILALIFLAIEIALIRFLP